MNDEIRNNYRYSFKNTYDFLKNNGFPNAFGEAQKMVENKIKNEFIDVTKNDLESLALEMYEIYQSTFTIPKSTVMLGSGSKNWFSKINPGYRYYWPRYKRYLEEYKKWELDTVESINESTDKILRSIGDPNSLEDFDVRGLVLGYVQSGKTANFTGLINKAFDVGYKLVIVLAGMHNDLRSQTQIRLEEEVVGSIDRNTDEKIGVAKIRNDGQLVVTWTTVDNDVSISDAGKRHNFGVPNLLVVKKNKDVLDALKEILFQSIRLSSKNSNVPVLIIDDEADQASIDTSNPNKNEDPKAINRLIREILELFKKKSYVGYTATPFANLLIRTDSQHDTAGKDLYPKDFVVALPKPKGYCGPAEYFNVTGYLEDDKPLFIRDLKQEDLDLFNSMKKTKDAEKFIKVPESMREAILAFLIAIAVRNLRGQTGKHNSMLIHTSRFTDTQGAMKEVIERYYQEVSNEILYNSDSKYIDCLEEIYLKDHVPVQQEYNSASKVFEWRIVLKEIKAIVSKVRIMEINGNSGEALEYQTYKDVGLNVIAIGGDKLSRGLTLEGLSVSYYYRSTNMYDTLMQMGRWFGFRTGYMDLCRIYTSKTIADYFEHMAFVMVELRKQFDYVANNENITPEEYAIKMLDHEKMMVTSLVKMRSAERLFSHSGMMRQTRIFDAKKSVFEKNMKATVDLINSIEQPFNIKHGDTTYHIVNDVPSELIIKFLMEYQTATSVNKVNSKDIATFVRRMNEQNELMKFNVVVVDGTESTLKSKKAKEKGIEKFPVNLGRINLNSAVLRALNKKVNGDSDTVDIGALVASNQQYSDLEDDSQEERNKNNPALYIYPLHPNIKGFKRLEYDFNEKLVPVGFAFSFPEVNESFVDDDGNVIERRGNYITNKTVKRGNNND